MDNSDVMCTHIFSTCAPNAYDNLVRISSVRRYCMECKARSRRNVWNLVILYVHAFGGIIQ